MNKTKQLGQFYTTNAETIIGSIVKFIPSQVNIIDPFCGNWDLLKLFPLHKKIGFDLDPQNEETVLRDTLKDPLFYGANDWIVTNPPYLAKNKSEDKLMYEKYEVDDLYQASIKAIKGCEGGILVLPISFFTSIDSKIREYFFAIYEIISPINIFEYQVFEDTTSSVCSFCFKRKKTKKEEIQVLFYFYEAENTLPERMNFTLYQKYGYKVGGELVDCLESCEDLIVERLKIGGIPNTKMKLYCLDNKADNKIRMEIDEIPFYGKMTDRMFATIQINIYLTPLEQERICQNFNTIINEWRQKYRSLFLTPYREFTRKRISYNFAYKIIEHIISRGEYKDDYTE